MKRLSGQVHGKGNAIGHLLSTLLVISLLTSCSLFKLKNDLEVLYSELSIISGEIKQDSNFSGQPIALIAEITTDSSGQQAWQLIDYRFPDGQGLFNFQIRDGDFRILAFIDQNGDFTYQPGEPATISKLAPSVNRMNTERSNWQFNSLIFDDDAKTIELPVAADVSPSGLTKLSRTTSTMGVQINYAAPHFDPEHVSMGTWEPSRWLLEVGHGFYLTEPWDSNEDKPLLLLVHGINDSPKAYKAMLKQLDTSGYRVALFHYPSGLNIDDNAYVLSQTINDMLIRSPGQKYVVLAHSMGGLIAKRFIHMQARAQQDQTLLHFISISTPWMGAKTAEAGLEYAPVVVPVWQDMAPSSEFIRKLRDFDIPEHVGYSLLFSHEGNSLLQGEPNDGSVSLKSQLDPLMQERAEILLGVDDDHVGILTHKRTIQAIERSLDSFR